MDPNPDTTVLHDEIYQAIDSVTVLGVIRLAVHAVVGAGGVFDETADDNAVAQGDTLLEVLNLPYVHSGAGWIRTQGGTDNAAAGTANQGQFVGGIVTDPLDAFLDGDFSLLHFDTAGRLLVDSSGVMDADDDAIVAGQTTDLSIDLNYGFDGTDWGRLRIKSAAAATSDERLAHLSTMAVLAMIDTTAPAGSMEIPLAANRNVGTAMTETGYFLPTRSAVTGYDVSEAVGSRNVPVAAEAAVAAQAYALNRLLVDSVVRGDDGTTYSAIAARNFDAAADVAAALIGLTTNSRLAVADRASGNFAALNADTPAVVSGVAVAAVTAAYVNAITAGIDNTAAAVLRPVEARSMGGFDGSSVNLVTLGTSSLLFARSPTSATISQMYGEAPSAVSGRTAGGVNALYTNSITVGLDNTGAAVLRLIEARAPAATIGDTLIRLMVQSSLYTFDGTNQKRMAGTNETSVSASEAESEAGSFVYQARADEFAAARRGKRFYGTHQTPGTLITAQTAFVDTTPTLMYRINSAAIRAIIRSLDISIGNTPGGPVYVTVAIDTSDRWSAGGTAIAAVNSNEESATAGVGLIYSNPTASAAGAGTRYIGTWIVPAAAAANCSLDFSDGILLGPTASTLLVYIWSAVTAAQVVAVLDYEEVS